MKTSNYLKKIFSQKGQGMVEYALLIAFVGAIAAFIMINGGFGQSVTNIFGAANDNISAVSGEATSFDYETLTDEDIAPNYKTLDWPQINNSVQMMYGTIMNSDTDDKAIKSESNLFNDLSSMVDGHLASTNANDGTKDWENFLSTMERMQAQNNFQSSYTRGEESFSIQRLGNSNAVQARYTDGKEVVYYRLSPDSNNVMQVETNSTKSYSEFMSPIINSGGWTRTS